MFQPTCTDWSIHSLAFSSTPQAHSPACLGFGVRRLQRCGAFREREGSDGDRLSPQARRKFRSRVIVKSDSPGRTLVAESVLGEGP